MRSTSMYEFFGDWMRFYDPDAGAPRYGKVEPGDWWWWWAVREAITKALASVAKEHAEDLEASDLEMCRRLSGRPGWYSLTVAQRTKQIRAYRAELAADFLAVVRRLKEDDALAQQLCDLAGTGGSYWPEGPKLVTAQDAQAAP